MTEIIEPQVKILCGLPTYDGTRWNSMAVGTLFTSNVDTFEIGTSLLASAFNRCWVEALNRRETGAPPVTHFMLLHADIQPVDWDWVQQLWQEFSTNNCQFLSVAVPIKSEIDASESMRIRLVSEEKFAQLVKSGQVQEVITDGVPAYLIKTIPSEFWQAYRDGLTMLLRR